ncbi:hypothetical protein DPSP01_014183 [Paraphaeosphaeria sporulosa]|uniref:Uncharacterized protein n=1 Tax=Paraphaeosphaeria sporulosa TaxID=1460663 RepID=A0A177C8Q1_9PLEO|nr:uncharacterized protein CC84DRAFT_874150 [Paraphaeosphaeria sporulosa]OAG03935.1 hypothetical protein CC84DRAFT_874150 [Paraphaeosphaeria sporulosa]
MAPLESSATAQSNRLPYALFAGQTALVAVLTANVLHKAYRAARALPPATATRAQVEARRRHAVVFSVLAFFSLTSVTTFAVLWRALSYLDWAHLGGHETPNTIWHGWYGTGEEGVGSWRLGDWLSDTDLIRASDEVAVAKPEAFVYTTQHFVALIGNAIFMGIEGRRRNLAASTIASFVILSATGSLGYALNLFFIIMLYTPLARHSEDHARHDALFTPKPFVFYVPVWLSVFALHTLPGQLKENKDVILLRWGYVFVPLFLAFAPQIVSKRFGDHYASKAAAHRSYSRVFYQLSIAAFILHWKVFGFAVLANTPLNETSVYDRLKHRLEEVTGTGSSTPNRLYEGLSTLALKLRPISIHPAVSVTTSDVFFASVSLFVWAFIRDLDVGAMLDNSVLSFLTSNKSEKHVEFEDEPDTRALPAADSEEPEEVVPAVTPKKRGRPRKSTLTDGATSSSKASSVDPNALKRPTRRGLRKGDFSDADPDDAYEPSAAAKRDVDQMETHGEHITDDLVGPAESTALALFLGFLGGLGQVSASVLGAEVTAE